MVRLFRTQEGKIEIDISGKKEGRGAYLCRDWACWETALKGKQLEHALKAKIDHENLERLSKDGRELLKELDIG